MSQVTESSLLGKDDTFKITLDAASLVWKDGKAVVSQVLGEAQLEHAQVTVAVGYRFAAADILKGGDCFPVGDPIHVIGDGTTTYLWKRNDIIFANFCTTLTVSKNMEPAFSDDAEEGDEVTTYNISGHGEVG